MLFVTLCYIKKPSHVASSLRELRNGLGTQMMPLDKWGPGTVTMILIGPQRHGDYSHHCPVARLNLLLHAPTDR